MLLLHKCCIFDFKQLIKQNVMAKTKIETMPMNTNLVVLTHNRTAGCESDSVETIVLGIFTPDKIEDAKTHFSNLKGVDRTSDWWFDTDSFVTDEYFYANPFNN